VKPHHRAKLALALETLVELRSQTLAAIHGGAACPPTFVTCGPSVPTVVGSLRGRAMRLRQPRANKPHRRPSSSRCGPAVEKNP
jgi:hypothetical protein